MGGLFSRWRTKPSTVEVLENIDKEIQALEEFREKNQRLQKLWVGRLILYSSVLYLFTCLIVYLWYLPDELIARLAMTLPFFAFPLIIWSIRTVLIFFFSKRTERNNEALDDLKSQKKKILEEVMEKETYKTAKLILERFDPDSKKAKEFEPPSAGATVTPRPGQGGPITFLDLGEVVLCRRCPGACFLLSIRRCFSGVPFVDYVHLSIVAGPADMGLLVCGAGPWAQRFVSELPLKETFLQHQQAPARALLRKFQFLLDHQRTLQPLVDPQKELLLQPYHQMCYQDVLDPLLLQCLEWRAVVEAACILSSKSGTTKLLPWELHSASHHQAAIALNFVCEHLCFVSIYFVHPLARCVLRSSSSWSTFSKTHSASRTRCSG
ncbi:endoplasmic reticulum junction formation protein lunapark isoform X4 [Ovis aries]|uniref:endoplasmic reticulum junction formation protein lunapark isoform X4 n=1 Tax=Ovis aries TaxID=9940 RepID=UPI001C2EA8B1|nr:endoplasmic reticulum junction formation protein lunapark isoform X4 [Ovis aries]